MNWEDTVAKLGLSDGDSLEIRVQGDQKLYDFEDEADNRIVLKLSGKWGSELLRVDKVRSAYLVLNVPFQQRWFIRHRASRSVLCWRPIARSKK